jgi:hypothetical protein
VWPLASPFFTADSSRVIYGSVSAPVDGSAALVLQPVGPRLPSPRRDRLWGCQQYAGPCGAHAVDSNAFTLATSSLGQYANYDFEAYRWLADDMVALNVSSAPASIDYRNGLYLIPAGP